MDTAEAERLLERSADHRVLRGVPPVARWDLRAGGGNTRRALFIDVESTGLAHDTDEVIELALLPFDYEVRTGAVVRVDEAGAYCGPRQPSFPIPAASTLVHGITDADVAGRAIDENEVSALVSGAERRPKSWWTLTEDAEAEIAWLNAEIYPKPRALPVIETPATKRYSARLWDSA